MKKALVVSTIIGFLATFERSDIGILQEMGYEVHIACDCNNYGSKERFKLLTEMGVIKHHIPFARSPVSKRNIEAYKQLKALINENRFDLVHCHTPVGGVLGRMAAHHCKIPVILYTAHGFHFFKGCPLKNRLMFYPIEKFLSRYTDILITINQEDYELAKKQFHAGKTERIHGVGIEIDKFISSQNSREEKRRELGIKEDEVFLFSVGELDEDKNHIVVFEAMKDLAHKGYRYLVAGSGHLKDSHNEYIKQNGLTESVQLLGYRTDISELLQAADIYVFPSLFEGLSVALMEAVAARRPVACSQVRGNVDTVITEASYFSPKIPASLIQAVERISSMTSEEKSEMVENNFKNLMKYNLPEVRKEMQAIYTMADHLTEKRKTV